MLRSQVRQRMRNAHGFDNKEVIGDCHMTRGVGDNKTCYIFLWREGAVWINQHNIPELSYRNKWIMDFYV